MEHSIRNQNDGENTIVQAEEAVISGEADHKVESEDGKCNGGSKKIGGGEEKEERENQFSEEVGSLGKRVKPKREKMNIIRDWIWNRLAEIVESHCRRVAPVFVVGSKFDNATAPSDLEKDESQRKQ